MPDICCPTCGRTALPTCECPDLPTVEYVTDADLRQGLDRILTSVGYTVAELQAMAKVDRFPNEDADRAWFAVDWILRCLAKSESADAPLDDIITALRTYGQGGERAGRVTCARAADELDRLRRELAEAQQAWTVAERDTVKDLEP